MNDARRPPSLGEPLDFLRVIWGFDHALQRASQRMEKALGVTAAQRMVVRIVGRFPGISAGQLAEILKTHPSTVTGLLKRLGQKKLITRNADPRDRRRLSIGLTAKGRGIDVETDVSVEAAVVTAFAQLGPGTIRTLKDGLEAISRVLDEVGAGSALPPGPN